MNRSRNSSKEGSLGIREKGQWRAKSLVCHLLAVCTALAVAGTCSLLPD